MARPASATDRRRFAALSHLQFAPFESSTAYSEMETRTAYVRRIPMRVRLGQPSASIDLQLQITHQLAVALPFTLHELREVRRRARCDLPAGGFQMRLDLFAAQAGGELAIQAL